MAGGLCHIVTLVESEHLRRSAIQSTPSYTLDVISLFAVSLSNDRCFTLFSFYFLPATARSILPLAGYMTLRRQCVQHPLQYVVPTLYGRDQSPGAPWGDDGDGAVFYCAGTRSGLPGWVLHAERYVVRFPGCIATGLRVYRDLFPCWFPLVQSPPPKRALSA